MATMSAIDVAEARGFQEGRMHMLSEFDDLLGEMFDSPFGYLRNASTGAYIIVETMKMRLKEEK